MQFIDQEVRLRATIIKLAEFSSVVLLDSVRPLKGVFSSITSSYVVLKMHGFRSKPTFGQKVHLADGTSRIHVFYRELLQFNNFMHFIIKKRTNYIRTSYKAVFNRKKRFWGLLTLLHKPQSVTGVYKIHLFNTSLLSGTYAVVTS